MTLDVLWCHVASVHANCKVFLVSGMLLVSEVSFVVDSEMSLMYA